MHRFSPALRELLLHAAVLLVVLGATIAGYNTRAPLVIQPEYEPERVFRGFHEIEALDDTTFRWTSGSGSICFEQLGHARAYLARVTLLGKGATALDINEVTFQADGQTVLRAPIRPAMHNYSFFIDGQHRQGDDLCITIASASTSAPTAGERRAFGVPVRELVLYRNISNRLALPAAGQFGLNVAAALLGFWLLRVWGLRARWAALAVSAAALLAGALVASSLTGAGMNTARNTLATVGVAGALLAGSLGTRWLVRDRAETRPGWQHHQLDRDLLAMALWSLVLWGSVAVLQAVYGHSGAWPLKAGVWPGFTPAVLLAVAAFVPWLALVLLRLRHDHPALFFSALLLLVGAIALPVLLKSSVRGWDSLFLTFHDNPSDYIHDVPLVGSNPLAFLGQYVERSPTLAWHNSNHPPGSVLLLWLVAQTLGPGSVPASWVAITLSGLLPLAALWLGWHLRRPHLALLAGALVVVMPGHTVYSVTSMDGIFNVLLALAAVAVFIALDADEEAGGKAWQAALAGALLALALFFTYTATQLAFFGLALGGLALARGHPWPRVLRQLALMAGVLAGLYLLLYLVSGFNIIAAVVQAKANNARLLGDPTDLTPTLMGLPTVEHYTRYLAVNLVPFLWYLGPWGLAALLPALAAGVRAPRQADRIARLALALAVLVAGMLLSGLFVREVERIWGFLYPLAAVAMTAHIWQGATLRVQLWRAGLWLSLFFAQSAVMRMLLNLYW